MTDSGIMQQVLKIKKVRRKEATHFVLCNGDEIRYLIAIDGGKKRLSCNISAYSHTLGILMRVINFLPFFLLSLMRIGYFANLKLHPEIDKIFHESQKSEWNMIVGTYDEKQKLVMQCFNSDNEPAVFIKIGNQSTEQEMETEINFLEQNRKYNMFDTPEILEKKIKSEQCPFNIQVTAEFVGKKVEPILTEEIVRIYREISFDTKLVDGVEYEFSHGDFAPWNIKKGKNGKYIIFDWEHCGYRMKGFDLMHYVTMIEVVMHRKSFFEAFDIGLREIREFIPDYDINKTFFLKQLKNLRTEIANK